MNDVRHINRSAQPRLLLGAAYSSIEPLGLLYLAGVARDLGWDPHIRLVRNNDFSGFRAAVVDLRPAMVGYTLYTGNHLPLYACFKRLKEDFPDVVRIIGGPHATYFPCSALAYAEYVVVSEGLDSLARILQGKADPGIVYPLRIVPFPQPERRRFYTDYPQHRRNPIKNLISMTGCPFACSYCYNSSNVESLKGQLDAEHLAALRQALKPSNRLFPRNMRMPQDVLTEIHTLMETAPETELLYWQDDTLGIGRHFAFLREFQRIYKLGIPFHGQTRFEMIDPTKDRGRGVLNCLREIGFTGMTMAIEAADDVLRREVLNRIMSTELIFDGVKHLAEMGFRLRTEQIMGLPTGATMRPTRMNLDADIELLTLNMNLRRESGGLPNISWATTLIPYLGTRMSDYCVSRGFVSEEAAENPEDGYHERSVLRHLRRHVGPDLERIKDDAGVWLESGEQERYRDQNTQLRYMFHILAYLDRLPDAESLVKNHFRRHNEFSGAALNEDIREHVAKSRASEAVRIWKRIERFERRIPELAADEKDRSRLRLISAFCGLLPGDGSELARRYIKYSGGKDEVALLSDIIKKYLFDTQLYLTHECTCELYDGVMPSGA